MCTVNRRSFLAACGGSLVGAMGWNASVQKAQAVTNFQYYMPANAFTPREAQILAQALNHIAVHLTDPRIIGQSYQTARRSIVDNNYCNAIGMPQRNDWSWACMGYQLTHYLRRFTPRVQLYPYYARNNYWANAPVGVVRTLDLTRATGRIQGEFVINVNRYWLGNGPGADSAVWAGVLAHEMMHNLGHIHGNDEYGQHLQINAIQQAVYLASAPMRVGENGEESTAEYADFVENEHYCGAGG